MDTAQKRFIALAFAVIAIIVIAITAFVLAGKQAADDLGLAPSSTPDTNFTPPPSDVSESVNQPDDSETENSAALPANILLEVPFTSQAPLGQWEDERQQDGCEEASVLMAMVWATGEPIGTASQAREAIIAISDWEQQTYGSFHDTSAEDTVERIIRGYFEYAKAEVVHNVTIEDIKQALARGQVVIVPANGKALNNPNFTAGGPDRHMLLIKGYDDARQQFITNDPGTRKGEGYRYTYQTLYNAIRDYETGHKVPIEGAKKAMITVSK